VLSPPFKPLAPPLWVAPHRLRTTEVSDYGGIVGSIRNLGTRWKPVVSFALWPLCSQRKRPRYQLNRSRSGHCGEVRNLYPHRESNPDSLIVQV
jgi:hypothetical protein